MTATPATDLPFETLISARAQGIDVSGIRRVFELGAQLENPINLSIGQPDFEVPAPIRAAACAAIEGGSNGYTLTQGNQQLLEAIGRSLQEDVGWTVPSDTTRALVTSGTSGALMLSFLALLDPGDEVIFADPYFVIYPALAAMCN
ncbi:MAG: aminotransferase class I/II-fold pyridoxal phosphate-dependent enzyme, partial [Planctomycetota bacterium]